MEGIITITKNMYTEALFSGMDVYLIDNILRGRYQSEGGRLLDAGAGGGRNLPWFIARGYDIHVVDIDADALTHLQFRYPDLSPKKCVRSDLRELPYSDEWFDHIICSAVLHFSADTHHFSEMYLELARVLKPGGTLFIRTAVTTGLQPHGIEDIAGIFDLPDGTRRFLATRHLLETQHARAGLTFLDPYKTVLVDGMRSMAVIMLQKAGFSTGAGSSGNE